MLVVEDVVVLDATKPGTASLMLIRKHTYQGVLSLGLVFRRPGRSGFFTEQYQVSSLHL